MNTECLTQHKFKELSWLLNQAKNSNQYEIANLAFAPLLHISIDDNEVEWGYEEAKHLLHLRKQGCKSSSIPLNKIKPLMGKLCLERVNSLIPVKKGKLLTGIVHARKVKCFPSKTGKQIESRYLLSQLEKLAPNWENLVDRYLDTTKVKLSYHHEN